MVDFKKLRNDKAKPKPTVPREIFNALPKPPGINDLYVSQAEVLDTWYPQRNEKDIVIKLHTGGGKTLVALLMAQSVMNETGESVLYLAPTSQLVEQVLAKSKEYGIPALGYPKGGGRPLPAEFYNGEAVLVGTYEALFNGHSKFGIRESGRDIVNVGAIILDDAHVALSSVRRAFTLDISVDKHNDLYKEISDIFRPAFSAIGRIGSFKDIVTGKDFGVIEVPSWNWNQKIDEVQKLLHDKIEEIDTFVWPFLRDNLGVCHCLFSKSYVSITPIFPPVDMLPTFEGARHRIYMSATIADDSEIVRTFGASSEAIGKPITSTSLAGVGERMILVPELMKLGTPVRQTVKSIATNLADIGQGVAILTPSGATAREWTDIAEYPETSTGVSEKVAEMQAGDKFGPLVLANRYDGIDLAGNACRFLVMDGLPQGTSNYDLFRANVIDDAAANSLLAQRIEQGIGRGARGGADYCIIMLVGTKLVGWIGRTKKNLNFLTASTRAQLNMGQEMSKEVTTLEEMNETIFKVLNRDLDWVGYHASELADAVHAESIDYSALNIAAEERKVFRLQRLGQYDKALAEIEKLAHEENEDSKRKAWFFALAARIAYQMGEWGKGNEHQTTAYMLNVSHSRPRNQLDYRPRTEPSNQSNAIVKKLTEYDQRPAILADFKEATTNLVSEASAARYEEALESLGIFLGFDAERPETIYGAGPDVLWRTDAAFDFVIEAKNQKAPESPLYKKDHAQLLEAEQWFKRHYQNREAVRVSALPEAVAHEKATPVGSFALRLDDVTKIVGALRSVITELVETVGDSNTLCTTCEAALIKAKLKPEMIRDTFMKPFGKSKRKS